MSYHKVSANFHIVISTQELQSVDELESYYNKNKLIDDYIISVEYGQNGHPHIDSYVQLSKEYRQDKFREILIKALYTHVPKEQRINIKVIINTLDSNPMYAIGYSLKENPEVMRTTYSQEYMLQSKEYYNNNVTNVTKQKELIQSKYKDKPITLEAVAYDFLKYCRSFEVIQSDGSKGNPAMLEYDTPQFFKEFLRTYGRVLPYTLFQKLKKETLYEFVKNYVDEDFD